MAWGILESGSGLTHVPGTSLLEEADLDNHTHLKRGTGKNEHILLVPQPSNDPNDPLNWPIWQRDMVLLLYCYCTLATCGGIGPIVTSLAILLIEEFGISFTQVSQLSGYHLCAVGAVAVFVSAWARKYGKRSGFVFSMMLCVVGSIWCAASKSYNSLLGGRILQGCGVAVFESVTFAIIGDMYHVHQRGTRMAFYVLAQSGIAHLPAIISGKISMDLGWRWVFWLLSIFLGIGWLLLILFGWETAFNRNAVYDTDISSQNNIDIIENLKAGASHVEATTGLKTTITNTTNDTRTRHSFFKRMRLFSGTYTPDPLWKMCLKPFFVLLNPAILWVTILLAFTQAFVIAIAFVIAQIFAVPPYILNTAELGYMLSGPMVFGVCSCILCGLVSDPLVRYLAKRNNGVYEPEFRLWLNLATPVAVSIGYFLFGVFVKDAKSPVVCSVMFGVAFSSVQFAANSASSYLVDAYREISIESFIISMTVKNFLFFGFSFFLNDWLANWGPVRTFNAIGGISLGICATTIPVYVFGKRIRAWWHIHDLSNKL